MALIKLIRRNSGLFCWAKIASSWNHYHSPNHRTMSISAPTTKGRALYVCGMGDKGQLGLGPAVNQVMVPTRVNTEDVVDVACGKNFTVFATEKGRVFTMGENESGCVLGNTSAGKTSFEPVPVEGLNGVNIIKVSAGQKHALALADDGSVYSWGCGKSPSSQAFRSSGILGHGDKESRTHPTRIDTLKGVRIQHISCGGQHSAVVSEDGGIYTWGLGEQGRLGHGNNEDLAAPRRIADLGPARVVTCGEHFCAAILRDGSLYTWGKNKVGELGHEGLLGVFAQESVPRELDRAEHFANSSVLHVACGAQHMLAVTEGGRVYVWGSAGFSHHRPSKLRGLSPPAWPAARRVTAVGAGCSYSVVLAADGGALAWGRNRVLWEGGRWIGGNTGVLGVAAAASWEVEPRDVTGLTGVTAAACGTYHTAFLADPRPAAASA